MTWTDAAIEAIKIGCDMYYHKGEWRPLVERYATLPGDWQLVSTECGPMLVPTPNTGAPNACLRLGRMERPVRTGSMPTVAL